MTTTEPVNIIDEIAEEYNHAKGGMMVDKWIDFFNRFQSVRKEKTELFTEKPYLTQIQGMMAASPIIYHTQESAKDAEGNPMIGCKVFQLDYNNLMYTRFDVLGIYDEKHRDEIEKNAAVLCFQIKYHYDEAQKDIKEAVYSLIKDYTPDYGVEIKSAEDLSIHLINFEETKSISTLSSSDLNQFVRLVGVIPQFDDQFSIEVKKSAYKCQNCNYLVEVSDRKKPSGKCPQCEGKDFEEDPKSMINDDFMYFVLQDTSEHIREGQMIAPTINCSVNGREFVRNIYRVIETGQKVGVNGVVRLAEMSRYKSTVATIDFEVAGIEFLKETTEFNKELKDMVSQEIPPGQINEHYEKLKRSICPHLEGLEGQKESILLALAGSPPLISQDGSRVRGELNILLLGDAATGKTELLKFVESVMPGSCYVQGANASKVGLTASVSTVEIMRGGIPIKKQVIDAGVYGIVRQGGFALIDELDKVADDSHYEAISTAMDDFQQMHIQKSKVHTYIKCHCGSIHAANPSTNQGRYDVTLPIYKQTNFHTWLLSRFDLKWLFLANRNEEGRFMLWRHKAKTHATVILEKQFIKDKKNHKFKKYIDEDTKDTYSHEYLAQEIAFLRQKYHPILRPQTMAWLMMKGFWDRYNKMDMIPPQMIAQSETKILQQPILDERAINSVIRIAQASARLHRRNEVDTADMWVAISLMKASIGMLVPHADEEREEARARVASTVVLNEGLRVAMKIANKETAEKIKKFTLGLKKTIKYMQNQLFNTCSACHGSGHMDDSGQNSGYGMNQHIPCTMCYGKKGFYSHFSYTEYEQLCKRAGTSIFAADYWKIMDGEFIKKENPDVPNSAAAVPSPRHSMFIEYYNVIVDLRSKGVDSLYDKINEMFGITDPATLPASM